MLNDATVQSCAGVAVRKCTTLNSVHNTVRVLVQHSPSQAKPNAIDGMYGLSIRNGSLFVHFRIGKTLFSSI